MSENSIEIERVCKDYGQVRALADVSLSIKEREFFTLLGPSGCGKTTLLRIIAGFETVSSGQVSLYGQEIGSLPPFKRPVNTVFQQYSLFPHMTVRQNVLFGLEMKGVARQAAQKRADDMLELVQLGEFADRKPAQLSGGQQQRVALARALAPEPQVLLLDEPLSALDLKLRQSMRSELKQIQQEAGITFVFVTHDQEEALTMSDRIAVMSQGEVQQVGDAESIYQRPSSRFVADFIGDTNFLDASVTELRTDSMRVALITGDEIECPLVRTASEGDKGAVCIRPESVQLVPAEQTGDNSLSACTCTLGGKIEERVFMGTDTQYLLTTSGGERLTARLQNAGTESARFDVGDQIGIRFNPQQLQYLV